LVEVEGKFYRAPDSLGTFTVRFENPGFDDGLRRRRVAP
jgi:hypothetical protein